MSSSELILNQLELANALANSKKRSDNKIALTLLDDIFEIALKEKADLVSAEEKKLLRFCHAVKNKKYSDDDHEHRLTRLSVLIEMYILRKRLPLSSSFTSHVEEHGHEAAGLLAEELEHQVDSIRENLESLARSLSDSKLKFTHLYGQHPLGKAEVDFDNLDEQGKMEVLLHMSYFIAKNRDCETCEDKERLDVLIEDLKEYLRDSDPRLFVDHEDLESQIAELKKLSADLAISKYHSIASTLRPLLTASREAASYLAKHSSTLRKGDLDLT